MDFYTLLGLVFIVLAVVLCLVSPYFEFKAGKKPPDTGKSAAPTPVTISTFPDQNRKSLDCLYAEEHDMWVCVRCETLNSRSTGHCQACGCSKNKM